MLKIFLYVFSAVFILMSACNDDVFQTTKSSGDLKFSRDTVFLDTVFTNTSSSTRTLKIYNRSSSHITIPTIKLGRGENSFYRLNVDGMAGKSFENIDILARDSLYVFIEATINFNEVTNPIYTDSIVFDQGEYLQDVKLVTLVQDAHFLFPKRDANGLKETIVLGTDASGEKITVDGFYLEGDQLWKNDKPYVIYGYVGVNSNNSLTIEKGVKVHFHKNSGLLVEKGATLKVQGALHDEVIFEGDRLEPFFSDLAGQWGTIWLRAGSKDHSIEHAIIKNSTIGILMDSVGHSSEPTLKIKNTQIYNTTSFGLLGRSANIEGENLVIANNAQASLACTIGGTYNFTHATFVNYWNNGIREFPTVLVNNYINYVDTDGSEFLLARDLKVNFTNSIIEGNQNIEFFLDKNDAAAFEFNFKNNLLKFNDANGQYEDHALFDFNDTALYLDNIFNGSPDFKDVPTNQYIIGDASSAVGKADKDAAMRVPIDILEVNRTVNPDIGAYQHIIFEDN